MFIHHIFFGIRRLNDYSHSTELLCSATVQPSNPEYEYEGSDLVRFADYKSPSQRLARLPINRVFATSRVSALTMVLPLWMSLPA
jgi:hypothetical protein